jgi:hypothetical protein
MFLFCHLWTEHSAAEWNSQPFEELPEMQSHSINEKFGKTPGEEKGVSNTPLSDRPKRVRQKTAIAAEAEFSPLDQCLSGDGRRLSTGTSAEKQRRRLQKVEHTRDNKKLLTERVSESADENKKHQRRRSKAADAAVSVSPNSPFVPPSLLSPAGRTKFATCSQNLMDSGLHKLLEDEDLMNFAAAVDRSLDSAAVDPLDMVNNTARFRLVDTRPDYYPADMKEAEVNSAFVPSEVEAATQGARGPRIKHVCRRAAVALGKPLAMFPMAQSLSLSALPSQEKERVLEGTVSR